MAPRQTPLQQLKSSKRKSDLKKRRAKVKKLADATPLTESQSDPQLSKLAAMRALQRTPQGNPNWASSTLNPDQLTLNDAPGGENFYNELRASADAMRDRAMGNFNIVEDNKKSIFGVNSPTVSAESVSTALRESSMPNQALEALGTTVVVTNRNNRSYSGRFTPGWGGSARGRRGVIEMNSSRSDPEQASVAKTITHEMGHGAESMARGGTVGQTMGENGSGGIDRERLSSTNNASSSGEGFADGIALRFGSSIGTTPDGSSRPPEGPDDVLYRKYSTYTPSQWQRPENQLAYIAHRAHAWSTGELPTGSLPERIHTMGANPDVRDAVRSAADSQRRWHVLNSPHRPPEASSPVFDQDAQVHGPDQRLSGLTSVMDVAKNLSEQFMDTRKTGRQLSLLGEQHEYDTYDVDKVDWDS